jgi:hypothetical protein
MIYLVPSCDHPIVDGEILKAVPALGDFFAMGLVTLVLSLQTPFACQQLLFNRSTAQDDPVEQTAVQLIGG